MRRLYEWSIEVFSSSARTDDVRRLYEWSIEVFSSSALKEVAELALTLVLST